MSWLKYAGKRLLMLIPVIICVTFVLFLILSAAPGDLARSLLGDDATPEQIAEKKAEMGLDQPLLVRYVRYMGGVLRLDFGESWINGEAVLAVLPAACPIRSCCLPLPCCLLWRWVCLWASAPPSNNIVYWTTAAPL